MSLITGRGMQAFLGFPRVSGDEPRVLYPAAAESSFSPRERG